MGIFDWLIFPGVPKQLREAIRIINKLNPEWKIDPSCPYQGIISKKMTSDGLVCIRLSERCDISQYDEPSFLKSNCSVWTYMTLNISILPASQPDRPHNWIELISIREDVSSQDKDKNLTAVYLLNYRNNTKVWREKVIRDKTKEKVETEKIEREKREKEEKRKRFLRTLDED